MTIFKPPDAILTPPLALRDACQILREIIAVYETSLVDPADRATDTEFSTLLEKAVDPLVEMCERMAELRKGATNWDKSIFLINCFGYLQHTLASVPFTTGRVDILEEKIQKHVESMTFEHVSAVLCMWSSCACGVYMTELRFAARQTAGTMRVGSDNEDNQNSTNRRKYCMFCL